MAHSLAQNDLLVSGAWAGARDLAGEESDASRVRGRSGIVIGHKGTALKKVGIASRKRLEDFFRKQVFLETRVKVKKNWREDEGALAGFGYL